MRKKLMSVLAAAMIVGGSAGTVLANDTLSEAVEMVETSIITDYTYKLDRDYYYFIPEETNTYQITLTDMTGDADLYLIDENENNLDISERSGSRDEKIVWKMEAGKKYYFFVRGLEETDYTLDIDVW